MNRRELLKLIVAASGTAFVGMHAVAYDLTVATPLTDTGFSQQDITLLNHIGETIIPATDSPGAMAAKVGEMIPIMVHDCYTKAQQVIFKNGLIDLQGRAKSAFDTSFVKLNEAQKNSLLTTLDTEAKAFNRAQVLSGTDTVHYFSMLKQQVMFCFFTSKVGATKAMRYVPIPGRYDGEYPYKKGDKAWATW